MIINKIINTVDVHVEGEPLRIITEGFPEIKGNTQLERRQYCIENLDNFRRVLMHEPRGHHGMYGCIITPPVNDTSDFGVLFMHNEGWSTMCGHGIIGAITMGIETGRLPVDGNSQKYIIDSPAGEITAYSTVEGSRVTSVSFENVPSFVFKENIEIEIENMTFTADISFGGAFYAVVNSKDLNLKVDKIDLPKLQAWGTKIKRYIENKWSIVHPIEKDLQGIYGVIFSDTPISDRADLRNVTIFADEQVDRSPCGTGTAARLATLYKKGSLEESESFIHEGITDGLFKGEIIKHCKVDNLPAIIPLITGSAYITGFHQFVIDPMDSLPQGFLLEEK